MKRILGMIMVLLAAVALMVAISCGSAATVPLPTQPPPTDTPVKERLRWKPSGFQRG